MYVPTRSGYCRAPIDVAADDRALPVLPVVDRDRRRQAVRAAWVGAEAEVAFHDVPAVVAAAGRRQARHRSPLRCSGRRRRRTGFRWRDRTTSATGCASRTTRSPGAPEPSANGLSAGMPYGSPESTSMRSIFPSSVLSDWPLPIGSPPPAAVAHADVQVAVRAERDHPAVVVGEWLIDRQQDPLRARIGDDLAVAS